MVNPPCHLPASSGEFLRAGEPRNPLTRQLVGWCLIGGLMGGGLSGLADESATIEELRQQIRILEEKVNAIEQTRSGETDRESKSTPTAPKTNDVIKIGGYLQVDGRFYPSGHDALHNDTFLLRRVRPTFSGTVFNQYDYKVMLDFGSGKSLLPGENSLVQDAYLNARFLPELQLQFGKFKEPVSLERLQSGANLLFAERSYPTQLAPNRDVGVQLQGDLFHQTTSYAVGVFNGVRDGGSADQEVVDDEKDVAARLFVHPFRHTSLAPLQQLGLGIAGTYGQQEGTLGSFVTSGQQVWYRYLTGTGAANSPLVVADGVHWRVVPQGYYYWGPFGLYGEYAVSSLEVSRRENGLAPATLTPTHAAWTVGASVLLTGEKNSFNRITPSRPFDPGVGWGAWELKGRIGQLDVDDDVFPRFANPSVSATAALTWGVGLTWHLNRNLKMYLDYENTTFDGGSGDRLAEDGEQLILGRIQICF